MNPENHLGTLQIEEAGEGRTTPEMRSHLDRCAVCRGRVARAANLERVLRAIPRLQPAHDLAPQIRAAVRRSASRRSLRQHPYASGFAAGLSALLALALVYQAGIDLQVGGALNFFSFYVRQPEVLFNYPGDALAALVEVLPVEQMLMTLTVVAIAAMLMGRFRTAITTAAERASDHHA